MPNYAARDETIRINSYTTVLRRGRVPHEVFATYWRDATVRSVPGSPDLLVCPNPSQPQAGRPSMAGHRWHNAAPRLRPGRRFGNRLRQRRRPANPLARRAFDVSSVLQLTVAGQRCHIRHAIAFAVSGVYTYVRDKTLTTASLHGSRAAQLIERPGSNNQVSAEVRHPLQFAKLP